MRFGIAVFPGSNCDEDAFHAARDVFGQDAEYLWHKDADLKGADVVILPGGFAHGDYLRTGAMARFSPIMTEVRAFADRGGPVLRIPIGHGEGNYFAPPEMLQRIETNRQVILRYADPEGRLDDAWNL